MVAEVFSGMIQGIEGQIVQIQADISNGLPNFYMTGYLSNEVKESKVITQPKKWSERK